MKQEEKIENKVPNQENAGPCQQFEPHQFKSSQCAQCFRSLAEHSDSMESVEKGIVGKVINLKSFGVQNGTAEGSGDSDISSSSALTDTGQAAGKNLMQPNNLSSNQSIQKGSRLRRQVPVSREQGDSVKNNLSSPKRINNSPGQQSNSTATGQSSTADGSYSQNGSITDNTTVQLVAYKLKSVNNLGSAGQTPPSAVTGAAAKAKFSPMKSKTTTINSKSESRWTKDTKSVHTRSQISSGSDLHTAKAQSNPALKAGRVPVNSEKNGKVTVASSINVTLKKTNKSNIPVRKSTDQNTDNEIQRIAKNLRPVSKTNATAKIDSNSKIVVPKTNKSVVVKPEEEVVDVEEKKKIVESKSSFASETLSKTAFNAFGHKHDTLPKRLREPQNRPSVKPLSKEDRNNSDPELFQSVQSEEVNVVSVSASNGTEGDITSHSQAVTSSQISSEIFFGKSPKKITSENDPDTVSESTSRTTGSVVIVDAAGNVSHFNTHEETAGAEKNAESSKSSKSASTVLPKEKAPSGFVIPYRVVDLDASSPCHPYKVVDIVSNPPDASQGDSESTKPGSIPDSQLSSSSSHRDTPTKFPKPSFSFPGSTNAASEFQNSSIPPPFPVILHDEKVTSPKEKGYENPSKVAIYIGSGGYDNLPELGSGGYDNLPELGRAQDEDDDLDGAIAVVTGYDNIDVVLPSNNKENVQQVNHSINHGNVSHGEVETAKAVDIVTSNENKNKNASESDEIEQKDKKNEDKTKTDTEQSDSQNRENEDEANSKIIREIDMTKQKRQDKGDTLTMGYMRPVVPANKSGHYEYMRQKSLSDTEINAQSPEYETLVLPTSPKASSDQSLDQILIESDDLPPSPRRRTSSMPDYAKKKKDFGHKRERSKTVEVVPTVSVETKIEQKVKPKRVAPPPPPPPPAQNKPPSPQRVQETQRRSRALSPSRGDTRTKVPPKHEEATADSMPRYPPPPPPPQSNKKLITPPIKAAHHRALSPARAMSPPIAITRQAEDPPMITNTPPKDDWIRPTAVMMESPQQLSSSPPRTDTKLKLPKFSLRKLLTTKKRDPEPPASPTRPVNTQVVQRWLNKQPYLSDDEMANLEVKDVASDPERSEISISESLTSADGLNKAVILKLEQDMAKKRRATRKAPPPPVPSGEPSNYQSGAAESRGQETPTNSPQLQKAYSLSPPSIRRLQQEQEKPGDYQNLGTPRAEAMSPKKPNRRERRGRNKTTGFEDLPSRRQAPAPPGHSPANHIYDEIPYDKKRQAPRPPAERLNRSAPAKPPRKLSFDDRLPVPAPRHKSSDERINEMDDDEMNGDVDDAMFFFEETERETHLKSALKHAQQDKIDSNRTPKRPVRIVAPEEELCQHDTPEEGISDPSYANLHTMLQQAAELAKRQEEQKRWSSSSDETIDSQKGIGKRPIPTPRAPVKVNRSTSPIMFPGNVRDKASVFEPSKDSMSASSAVVETVEADSQAAENINEPSGQETRLNEINLTTLKRMMTMWKVQEEEHIVINEVSWNDLILTSEDPRFTSSDTVIYSVTHNEHQNQPLAVQVCTKPENKERFLAGMQVCRSITSHPNIFQVSSIFTDNVPERVLGLEPASPKNFSEDEPGTSSPVEKFIEVSAALTNRQPTTQADLYMKHSKEMHEFLPQKYEHDVCLLLLQLFKGLKHLDMHHIVHGELKMENLFLVDSKLPGGGTQLVIANFPSAKQKTEEDATPSSENKTQEFEAGLMIYEFLHEKSPFVTKTLLITQDYSPADLPTLPQLSSYSQGLNKLAGELLRRHPSDRLSADKAVAVLQSLLWGPPGNLLQDITDEATQMKELQNWLDLERAKAVNTIAEKHLATLFKTEQGISLEDHLQCQFLSEISISALRDSYRLLNE
ncbi:inactive tyrosine-protein kinase PEAK1-like [Ptychodera flava]|uniref:inactive tyrosine-protein kinase PEAK1-like n=1 Tax=Ptychodera flava TaxID=63121 RepID=UPI003969C3D0